MNDTLTFGQFLVQKWADIVAYGEAPWFPWAVAAILITMLGCGIWQTVKAQDRTAAHIRETEQEIASRLEKFAKSHYGPALTEAVENTRYLTEIIKKIGAHFARINDLQQIERILREVNRSEQNFNAVIAANKDIDPNSHRSPLERWDSDINDKLSDLHTVASPYLDHPNNFNRHVSSVDLDSFDCSEYQDLKPHLRKSFAHWQIMKRRVAALEAGPLKKLRQSVQSVDRFLQNLGDVS